MHREVQIYGRRYGDAVGSALQEGLLQNRAKLIQLRYALLANRINFHLALGGGFDAASESSNKKGRVPEEMKKTGGKFLATSLSHEDKAKLQTV